MKSLAIGSVPLVNDVMRRMRLEEFLGSYLPRPSRPPTVPYAKGVATLVRNILLSREPVYGVGDWAREFAPDVLRLRESQVAALNDDRVGRCLDQLFASDFSSLVLAVTAHVVKEFDVSLEELHNDSTTITFHGSYEEAWKGARVLGKETRAITWGHNKDHRPDLKQLLFILTASRDGGVPLSFTAGDGNLTDDQTHRQTWDLLRELAGRSDFLYVADSKFATRVNLQHVRDRGGRYVTVLPRTRAEDRMFRERLQQGGVSWKVLNRRTNDRGELVQVVEVCEPPPLSADGDRIFWYRDSRKRERDRAARQRSVDRAQQALADLHQRLGSPRTRFRQRAKVEEAVQGILEDTDTGAWIQVQILECQEETFHQEGPGRTGPHTRYRREVRPRFELHGMVNHPALDREAVTDGIFPVVTNDLQLEAPEVLAAYKRQPVIETRFSQLKSDLWIAPIYLHNAGRVEALLCAYFFALMTQTLLEREIRQRMEARGVASLPLYHENRACKAPTARRILDAFGNVQRHELHQPRPAPSLELVTELSPLQRQILELLDFSPDGYGRRDRVTPRNAAKAARG